MEKEFFRKSISTNKIKGLVAVDSQTEIVL